MSSAAPVAVLGAGSWGTALAIHLARKGREVQLWGHRAEHCRELSELRENRRYLPGHVFPSRLTIVEDLGAVLQACEDILIVVPSHALRQIMQRLQPDWRAHHRLALACKGLEYGSGCLPHEVAESVLGGQVAVAAVSGPNFAREVAAGLPTGVTVAAHDEALALTWATCLHDDYFRAYISTDIVGVEAGGAVKNVMAIAAGVADGLHLGANTRATLITRGLAEIMRLGLALGGHRETFMGLAGLGDLVLTCTDDQSRNRRLGLALGQGRSAAQAQSDIAQVVEGVPAAQAVWQLAQRLGIEMPITEQVYRVLYEDCQPRQAVERLLSRHALKFEHG